MDRGAQPDTVHGGRRVRHNSATHSRCAVGPFRCFGKMPTEVQLHSCRVQGSLQHVGVLVPRPGIEPMSPALEGRFVTTGPPGKSQEGIAFISR